jgi:hypothetical protein
MGPRLLRRFVSLEALIAPEKLAEIKITTQALEAKYPSNGGQRKGRRVNIDPGYLETDKVVLATTKNASHRVYLHSGIYGEVTLRFREGAFERFDYTYPDYGWEETLSFFAALRSRYLSQMRC